MFLCLAAMAGIGLMMKYVLVPGKDRVLIYGRNVELYFLNLDRHQWGTVHLIVSFTMLSLLAVHIILHWKAVINQFKSWVVIKSLRRIFTVFFIIICFVLVYFPVRISPEVEDFEGGRGRLYQERFNIEAPESVEHETTMEQVVEPEKEIVETSDEQIQATEVEPEESTLPEEHKEHDTTIDVQGYMTLKEVADTYQVPVSHLKSKLEIPYSISENERLGRLRRTYGFTMSDVQDIIIAYKNSNK